MKPPLSGDGNTRLTENKNNNNTPNQRTWPHDQLEAAAPATSVSKDTPPSVDMASGVTSYQTLLTPKFSFGGISEIFTGLEMQNTGTTNGSNPLTEQEQRSQHRNRFLNDAERVLTNDRIQTRQSFRDIDAIPSEAEWHDRSIESVLEALEVRNTSFGLSKEEIQKRVLKFGPNSLEKEKKTPVLVIFLLQFMNLIIGLLMAAAVASIALQEFVEGLAIIVIVTINALIATIQERSASNALDALNKMASPQCVVIRGGKQEQVPNDQLVPGDIVHLGTGDVVPADIRLLSSSDLKVKEIILTGEPHDVPKKFDADVSKSETLTAQNMVFSCTTVATGNATGVVVETAMNTRVGRIAELLKSKENEASSKNFIAKFFAKYQPRMTPLQESLHHLGVFMGTVVIGVCIVVFIVGMVRGNADPKAPERPIWLTMVMVAVSLAVSAVPEGLPMVVTICLSKGTSEMVKKNVLVRKLAAVESLGASSVICTDKTGTLTEGKMTAVKMWADFEQYNITGVGFEPTGDIFKTIEGTQMSVLKDKKNKLIPSTLLSAVLCTNTTIQRERDENGNLAWVAMGNSSEAPLVVAGAKIGIWRDKVEQKFKRVGEIPFSSSRKMMVTVNEVGPRGKDARDEVSYDYLQLSEQTRYIANVKGAPNYILQNCTQFAKENGEIASMSSADRERVSDAVDFLSSQALRVLAIAIKPLEVLPSAFQDGEDDAEQKFGQVREPLIFLGLVASIDPAREGVKEAIQVARKASIRTVMITGDYLKTAIAIARNIDLLPLGADLTEEAIDCEKLRPRGHYLSDIDMDEITSRVSVFARAKPEDKLQIVQSLQRQGQVSAMTGDGVNDAPALKEADIGVAMGITGTAVAKGASDMILTDDNFCSIVCAVEKGREIYANIQKFVCFLLSTNFGEITMIFTAIAIGMPNPLEPLQILVLNLFADGMAAVALSLEKGEPDIMKDAPRPKKQQIIHGRLWVIVLTNALWIAIGALAMFTIGLYWNFENIFLEDILEGASKVQTENMFKDVVCNRWTSSEGWKLYGNCDARFPNGTSKFDGLDINSYSCESGKYECVSEGISRSQTMAFVYITTMEMFRAYTARSFTKHVFRNFFTNKWMQVAAVGSITLTLCITNIPVIMDDLFGFAYIEWYQWVMSMSTAILMVFFSEMVKCGYRTSDKKKARWLSMERGFETMLVEIRNLRHHVERLEGRLVDCSEMSMAAAQGEKIDIVTVPSTAAPTNDATTGVSTTSAATRDAPQVPATVGNNNNTVESDTSSSSVSSNGSVLEQVAAQKTEGLEL